MQRYYEVMHMGKNLTSSKSIYQRNSFYVELNYELNSHPTWLESLNTEMLLRNDKSKISNYFCPKKSSFE